MSNPEKFCAEELAEKFGLEYAQRLASVPDERINRHDIPKAAKNGVLFGASARAEYTAKVVGEVRKCLEFYAERRNIVVTSTGTVLCDHGQAAKEALRLLETLAEGDSLAQEKGSGE